MSNLLSATLLPMAMLALFAILVARRSGRVALSEALVVWAVSVGLTILVDGIGYTWNAWSLAGKIIAIAVSVGLPLAFGVAGAMIGRGRVTAPISIGGVVFACGLPAVLASPFVHLVLVVVLTGDAP